MNTTVQYFPTGHDKVPGDRLLVQIRPDDSGRLPPSVGRRTRNGVANGPENFRSETEEEPPVRRRAHYEFVL